MSGQLDKQYVDARAIKELFLINNSILLCGAIAYMFSLLFVLPEANRLLVAPLALLVGMMFSLRFFLNSQFLKLKNPSDSECIKWGKIFITAAILNGLAISVGYIVLIPDSRPVYDAILFVFLVGISAGAVACYSWYKPAAAVCVIFLICPFAIASFVQGTYIDYAFGVCGFLYVIVILAILRRVNAGLIRSIVTQKELEDEVAHRTAVEQETSLLNEKLLVAKEAAESASKVKGEFLANMSHEIRTPMNAIIGLSYLALKTDVTEQQADYLQKIDNASNGLLNIIEDILDISKMEAGNLVIEPREFCLNELLVQVTQIISIEVSRKNLSFLTSVDPDTPLSLVGDSHRLLQVLINLVNNAVKFTSEGTVSIEVSGGAGDDGIIPLTVSVKDQGIGISEDKLLQLFDAFSQADSSTTRKYGGTGLGLSISKNLVELMGGEISIESTVGEGSCFSFTVPLGIAEGNVCNVEIAESPNSSTLEGISVLVAEDHHINQQVIQEFLEGFSASVEVVNNGKEAVATAENRSFDLILMDVQMPEMDGYKATEIIRKSSKNSDTPIIAMTAHAMPAHIEKCKEIGMNDHLAKPLNPALLQLTIGKWIHRTLKDTEVTFQEDETDCLEIYGVDVSHGLSLLRGKKHKYHALLQDFYNDFSRISAVINSKAETEEQTLIKDLHTLAGCAGNIGAFTVSKLAQTAEKSLKNDTVFDLSELREELAKVLESINELPVPTEEKYRTSDISCDSGRSVPEILSFVLQQVEKRAFSLSDDILDLKPYYQKEIEHLYAGLEQAVDSFNFEKAHALVTEMIKSQN